MADSPKWLAEPEEHDYTAAANYLTLVLQPSKITAVVKKLRSSKLQQFAAKDVLRASRLPHLDVDNPHVAHDLKKADKNEKLSPILLVRGNVAPDRPLIIADGYHRACAALHLDENALIPCKLVDL